MKRDPNAVARDRANAAAEADVTRTELAAIWPPTASAAREAGHKPQSHLSGNPRKVPRLLLLPAERNPALRGGELRPMALQGRQAPLAGRGAKNPAY